METTLRINCPSKSMSNHILLKRETLYLETNIILKECLYKRMEGLSNSITLKYLDPFFGRKACASSCNCRD
jgi:hypothetical protein